jgi:hypothetical protein
MAPYTLLAATFLGLVAAQTPGTTPEVHPKLYTWKCTKAGGCKAKNTSVVLDSATKKRIHQKNNSTLGCGSSGKPDPTVCPDEETCAKNCIIEGVQDYKAHGVFTNGGDLRMDMYNINGSVASPRVYLLAEDEENYEMMQLTGNELTFDVDVSKLPCGMNGALYLSEMEADGGRSELNPGGAYYGTGYCDAQCYVTPWINGVVSRIGTVPEFQLTLHRAMSRAKVCVVTRWMSGRPTAAPPRSRLMSAAKTASSDAQEMSAAAMVCATRADAETTHIVSVMLKIITDLAVQSTLRSLSLSLLNSLPRMAFSKQSYASTFRTVS